MPLHELKRRECVEDGRFKYEDIGNSTWTATVPHVVSVEERCLYVHQGEIGYGMGSRFDIVGSDDATTCVIVLARNRANGSFLVTHVDCEGRAVQVGEHIDSLMDSLSDNNTNIVDIYISGGMWYMPDSVNIMSSLLASIQECSSECYLRLLNFEKNCGEEHFSAEKARELCPKPIVSGCGFLIRNQNDFDVIPMKFPLDTRGPLPHFRQAIMMTSENLSVVCHLHSDRISVSPAGQGLRNLDEHTRGFYLQTLSLSDEDFLQTWSTSPNCEPPHFVSDFKKTISCILQSSERNEKFLSHVAINGASFQLSNNKWVMV